MKPLPIPFRCVIAAIALLAASAASAQDGLPLSPERTVEFTTDEGTWLSLDVSPDGRTLVFDLAGQLYTLPVGGGEAKRITQGMAFSSQPRFSPDGKRLAFISDASGAENLWIADADGSNPRSLSHDDHFEFASPSWLPDGQEIVVSRRDSFSRMPKDPFAVRAYHVNGGAGVAVTKTQPAAGPGTYAIGAVASPDGKYLYYTQRSAQFDDYGPTSLSISQIARRDRVTGMEDVITAAPGAAFRPVLSPDGTQLVYGTRYETETGLKLLDLRTAEERWLKYPVQRDDEEAAFSRDMLPGYAFAPDGKALFVSYGGKIHRLDVAGGADQLIPFTAKVSQELGPLLDYPARVAEGPVRWRILQGIRQSPDGKRLAFSAATHVYAMEIGDTPRRLTNSRQREYQPVWSPDGRWVAYVTWSTAGGHIWKVRGSGGAPTQLTQVPAYYRELAWSPDGARIVALRGARQWQLAKVDELVDGREMLDLISVPAQGGQTTTIARARGARQPHFVDAQTDRVYLFMPQGLVSMRLDGTDMRTHVKIMAKEWFSDPLLNFQLGDRSAQISPDGRWIAARASSQAYLFPAPSYGGEPVTIDLTPARPSATAAGPGEIANEGGPGAELPIRKLTRMSADSIAWAQDSSAITWNVGASFFRFPVSSVAVKRVEPQEIAVNLEFPRAAPKGDIVLRGAKVITMRGDEVIDDADILVRDHRIANVGARDAFAVPAGAKILDVSGTTIVPGFIDLHAHWFEIRRAVLDPDNNWPFFANLAYGVTTGRDVQTETSDTFAYQDLVDMGEIPGPRTYATGPGVFPFNDFQSYEDTRDFIARYKKYYGVTSLKSYLVGNRRQRQWVVQACKALQIMPTTEGDADAKLDLTHVIDGFAGNEHSLPITPLYKDVVQLLAQSKITYTPTLIVSYGGPLSENYFYETTDVHGDAKLRRFVPHDIIDARARRRPAWYRPDEYVFERLAVEDRKLIEAGARVTIGSHGQLQGLGYHWEMWALASGGLSPHEVLRSATLRGAQGMGLAQDLGSIEAGKLADLVILSKDPLLDIRNTNSVQYVMKNGQLFEGETLNEIWPGHRVMPDGWWAQDAPRP